MRKIYLFTSNNDRERGPVQQVVSTNEIVCIYIDNEYYTVCRAVPDTGKTCFGCALCDRRQNFTCLIKVKSGNYIFPKTSLCNYNTLLKPIDDILEDL